MNVIIFDSETSGLPDYKQPSEAPQQPHIVELACLLYNSTGAITGSFHSIVKPDGWTIPDEVAAIHGITTERAMDEGIPEHEVVRAFMEMQAEADLRVAHNEAFDQHIMHIAIKRFYNGMPGWEKIEPEQRDELADMFKARDKFCTMKASTKPCALPPTPAMMAKNMKWNKNPTLAEAYKHWTGNDMVNAHSALADTHACAEVFFALKRAGLVNV
jgi:DNA polymerase-3 subunit epsilon